ncbi:probable 18S rRNA (guanine-N(7))-methyltransferase [Tiliqua scincoides]|uniref:probable 18S rRNA (guanine-N(7))-methyltransferase n=1 Tax=Tiliqua scincoides TaxID=71010 RepID=UPI0034629168
MVEIQSQMTERAVELLGLAEDRPCFLLDVGCGSCLSGDYLSEEGHCWVGLDISSAMLDVALEREVEGDLMLADMGQGIPFRPGMFDGCISISAVQLLQGVARFKSKLSRQEW